MATHRQPTSTLPAAVLADLRRALPAARVRADPVSLRLYEYDAAFDRQLPAAVALPETTAEVAALVRVCRRHGLPYVPRGAGTSLSGGPLPAPGSLVISLARLNRLREISPADRVAVVQPGVVNLDLQEAVAPYGLFYAPDPSSQLVSTVGGNLGHNAGGAHCLKYGVTANHVLAVELVTPEGEVTRLGSRCLAESGLRLPDLLIGGEGTLGIATEITCRLLPLPGAVRTLLAAYDSLEAASATVSDLIAQGIVPAALEMIDRPLIRAVEQTFPAGYPQDAAAVLLIDVDGPPEALEEQVEAIRELCGQHGATEVRGSRSEAERAALWKGRKATAAAIANLAPGKISTDVVVPRNVLPQMVARVAQSAERHGLLIGNILHAGDGNLHPQIIFDPREEEQVRRVWAAQRDIIEAALELGGGITGEHGVGTEKRRYMPLMFAPAELALLRRIKQALDPAGLCNPGKILPDEIEPPAPPPHLPAGGFDAAADELAVRDEQGRLRPYDYEALAKLLALAARERQPVFLAGAGTQTVPPSERVALGTPGLHHLVCLQPENMTIAAQAGMTRGELQEALAAAGQWWPVLPPGGPGATLGGVAAVGEAGPWSARYGRLADLVTAVRLALPTGELVRFGLPCMKNVAGYAVERLMCGSRGTLAAIVELTLRTLPLPQRQTTLAVSAAAPEPLGELAQAVLARELPAGVELVNPPLARELGVGATWTALFALHGREAEVAAMERRVREEAAGRGLEVAALPEETQAVLWPALAGLANDRARPGLRAAVPPSACAALSAAWVRHGRELEEEPWLAVSPATGELRAPGQTLSPALAELLTAHGALLLTPSAVDPVFAGLRARLKLAFDPAGILPGWDEA